MPCSIPTARAVLLAHRRRALFALDEQAVRDWYIRRRSTGAVMFGVSVARPIGERMYFVQVGQDLAHRDVIIDDVVPPFFPRVAWITFPILLLLLLIDILIFRRALEPVREASTTAASIGPQRTEVRLPEQAMPAEIAPLVHAVNQALDRLEAGFRAQRDFTADMAHELRTPLAIVRARVDSLEPGPLRDALRTDLVNMTRTVNQVLDIAELESFVVATDATRRPARGLRRCRRLHGAARGRHGQDHRADRRAGPGLGARPCRGAVPRRAQSGRERDPPYAGRRLDRGRGDRPTASCACSTTGRACRRPTAN